MSVKVQKKKHQNCVICGKGFNAEYDPVLNLYPVYHPKEECPSEAGSCEFRFYENLLEIYKCLHDHDTSMKINHLIDNVKWGPVQLKRELVAYCLNQGYLDLDKMERIKPQEAVNDLCNEVFEAKNLAQTQNYERAISFMRDAIRYLNEQLSAPEVDLPQTEFEDKEETVSNGSTRRMFTIDMSTRENTAESRKGRGMYSRS